MLEVPVGTAVHRYPLPSLAAGATHEESFTIRTRRRGVIPVGPGHDPPRRPARRVLARRHLDRR